MAYLNICGFETGDTSELIGAGGTYSVQSSIKRTGTYALRINPTTTGTGYGQVWGLAADGWMGVATMYCTWYGYIATLPSSSEEVFAVYVNDGGSGDTEFELRVTSGGVLKLYRFNPFSGPTWNLVATGTTALSTGVWYRIDWKATAGGSAVYELKIDGTAELSGTQAMGGTNMQSVMFGKVRSINNQSVDFYYDDIAISDSAYPGAGQVNILKPNGAGTYSQFTGSYTDVDEVPHDSDTTYLEGSTSGSEKFHNVNLDSASTGGVSGSIGTVKVIGIARKTNANSHAGGIGIGTSIFANIGAAMTTSYATYAFMQDTNPIDSQAWESADLDALLLVAYLQNTNATTVRYTAAYAMVWCTGQINTTVTPGAASLTLTAYSPSAKVNNIATPGALSLTTTRYTPSAILNNIATPGALSAALTAYAPAATVGLAVTPGTLATALTAYTPTLLVSQSATPGTLALATTRYTPTALLNSIATPGALSAALTAYAPAVTVGLAVTPGALATALTAYTPTVINPQSATPGAGAMALTAYGPSVLTPVVVTPATLSAVLTAHAPSAPVGTKVTPGAGAMALTAYGLAVNIGWQLTPGPASLAVMTYGLSWTLSGFPNPDRRLYGAGRFGSINRGTGRSDQPGRGAGR